MSSRERRRKGETPDGSPRSEHGPSRGLGLILVLAVAIAVAPAFGGGMRIAHAQTPLWADVDGSGDISAGDTLSYAITATNTGGVTLTNVVVSDQLSGLSTACGTLAPGGSCVLNAVYGVTAADVRAGVLSTTATATSDQTGPVPLPAPQTLFLGSPALSISAREPEHEDADRDGIVSAGDALTYEITATNTGTANLTNLSLGTQRAQVSGGNAPCALVAPGQTCTLSGKYTLTEADARAETLEELVTASSDQTGPLEQSLQIAVPATPALLIMKDGRLDTGADGIANPGDKIIYSFRVTNTGNVSLEGVMVNDPAAGVANCSVGTLAAGAVDEKTCTGTYTLTQEDIDAGSVTGQALAIGRSPVGEVRSVSEGGATAFSIPQAPALAVERVLAGNNDEDGSNGVSAGDLVTFEVTATNTGNVMLTNVKVGERLTGDETGCASLAPVNTCVLTLPYSVTKENATSGIPNLAYASSDQTGEVGPLERTAEVASARLVKPTNFLVGTPGLSGISTDVDVVGTNLTLAVAAILTLLVATTVFNSTLEENAAEIDAFVRRVSGSPKAAPAFAALGWISEEEAGGKANWLNLLKPGIIVLVTALIYALLDPNFGFNDDTLVVVCALIAGLAVSTFLYEGGQVLWSTKHFSTPAAMRVYPLAILIAIACVGLTRLTNLHPGIIFGFVTAAAIFPRGEMTRRANGEIIAVPLISLMVAALVAFLLIDPLHDFTTSHDSVFASLPETIAVSVFVGGAGSALLILIPVTFNDGEKIWNWNKLLWFALALPATFAFIHVLVNDEDYGTLAEDTNTMTLLALCAVVLVIAAGTWLFFRLRRPEGAT